MTTGRPGDRFTAMVFDVDGTLADSERLAAQAWRRVLGTHGLRPRPGDLQAVTGRSFADTRAHFARQVPGLPDEPDLWQAYWRILRVLIRRRLRPFPDALATLRTVEDRGVPVAVASSSPRPRLDATLRAIGLSRLLPVSVAGDEVHAPKPAPDIYRVAAAVVGVAPEACLAVEDSEPGVAAARAAGMYVIGIRREPGILLAEADLVLDELDPDLLAPKLT